VPTNPTARAICSLAAPRLGLELDWDAEVSRRPKNARADAVVLLGDDQRIVGEVAVLPRAAHDRELAPEGDALLGVDGNLPLGGLREKSREFARSPPAPAVKTAPAAEKSARKTPCPS